MAWTAHKDPEKVKEYCVERGTLEKQAEQLADWIKGSRHFIAFTGAGISTAAGIPDFRGPEGVWTLRAQGKSPKGGTSTIKAFPTPAHMSLVSLEKAGALKFLISQNCDGIHRRSGFPPEKLAELHGNSNLERCQRCGKEYLRDSRVRTCPDVHGHRTGRYCACGGELHDTIINFGENLPEKPLREGFWNSKQADLCLVLGSSLTVTPAADMPRTVAERGGRLVVCNMQQTPLDPLCALRIFAKTDDLMRVVMEKLGVDIFPWKLQRHFQVALRQGAGEKTLIVKGMEPDGTPASIFRQLEVTIPGIQTFLLKEEPFKMKLPAAKVTGDDNLRIGVKLVFMGHYNEPDLPLNITLPATSDTAYTYRVSMNFQSGAWETERVSV